MDAANRRNTEPEEILRSKLRELEAKHHTALDTIESLQAEVERLEGVVTRCDEEIYDHIAEVERLRAGIWEMVGILGFDQDGAEHHHLTHPDIVAYGVERATEMRKDYDEANDDFNAHYKGSGTTT